MTALLTDNLPLLAGAPNGIKKLRELILELAVRGKLVPQDPNDEPARELLKRIAEEKARLVIDGSSKKQKQLAGITQDETPFDVPAGWCWVRMGSVGETNIGLTYSPSDVGDVGIPVLRSSNVQKGQIDLSDLLRVDMSVKDSALVQEGDLLICARNGSKALVGKTAMISNLTEPMAFGAFMAIFRSQLNPYLLRFINSPLFRKVIDDVNTTTINQITQNSLRTTLLPLPPLAEQHRIVAKVNELMALCDRLEARQADADSAHGQLVQVLLDSLTQARDAEDFAQSWQRLAEHFHTLFTTDSSIDALKQILLQLAVMGKLVPQVINDEVNSELPAGWSIYNIGEFCTVQGGIQKTPLRRPVSQHFPYLRVANVQRGRIDLRELERYELSLDELEKWRLNAGDLLIVEGNGSESEIGRCAIWQGEVENCVYQNHLMRVRPQICEQVEYLALYLNSPIGMAHMRRLAITTSGLFNLSVGKIRSIPVALPPQEEQHRIVAKVDQLMALCDQLKARLDQARQVHEQLATALVEQAVA